MKLYATSAILAACSVTSAAYAQQSSEGTSEQAPSDGSEQATASTSSGDIIVTGRKRPERLLDTPASLTVFSTADLERQKVTGIEGLANSVPSLYYQQRGSLTTAISIRGVGGDPRSIGLESGVSVAIDGASVGRTNAYNTALFEIAQIEVLRGPQGTIFGTNSIGGLLNITTVKPSEDTHANAFIDIGNYSSVRTGAALSGKIADNLFAGLNVATWQGGGYIYNDTRGIKLQGHDRLGFRAALRWLASDRLEFNASADWTRDNQDLTLQQLVPPYIGLAARYTPKNRYHVNMNDPSVSNLRTYGANITATYDLGTAALTSVTSYRNTKTNVYSDGDSFPVSITATGPFTDESRLITQELRISSTGTHRLQYVTGIYFQNQIANAFRHLLINGSATAGGDFLARIETTSYAAFANLDYKITDSLSVIAGGRYNIEVKDGSYSQIRPSNPALTFNFPNLHRNDKQPSFAGGLKYKITPLISSYVTVSTGKKSGGFNVDPINNPATTAQNITFKPESLVNYEAGIKGQFFNRALTLSASIFQLNYTDRQVGSYSSAIGSAPTIIISNAGKSRTKGFEIEGSLSLPDDLNISASLSHLDGKYTSFPNATAAGAAYTGNITEFTPDYTASINLDKTFHLSSGDFVFHGDTHYQGNTYLDASQNRQNFQASYWLFNGRAGYEFKPTNGGTTIGAYLWIKNLTKKDYLIFARQAAGANTGLYGDPRTFGLELRVKY